MKKLAELYFFLGELFVLKGVSIKKYPAFERIIRRVCAKIRWTWDGKARNFPEGSRLPAQGR